MRALIFEGNTWLVYKGIRDKDRKLHRSLCRVIKELLRANPAEGSGKPERLKHDFRGFWSRRISQKDRIIYKSAEDFIYIVALGGCFIDTKQNNYILPL